jgi:hypothetical protein
MQIPPSDFHFYLPSNAASSKVRGIQMASALGGTFALRQVFPAEVVVFVKEPPSPRVLEHARHRCAYVAYDPVDDYRFGRMAGLGVDAVIACNSVHAERLASATGCDRIVAIPHHHCMIQGEIMVCDRGPRVGYVGDGANLGLDPSSLGPEFLCGRDLSILGKIGIGIAYRPEGEARLYKSGVKLANYWANSVAAVCSPDASFLEMGTDGEDMLVARSADDVVRLSKRLAEDGDLRMRLVTAGAARAADYGIGRIGMKYLEMLEILKGKNARFPNAKKAN